jgi:MerR family transcriptional regulator, heat shock protein HspR
MMNGEGNEPRYVISIAARLVGVRTHTLRYYEKIGIVEPSRSQGNIRLYSEEDVEMLRRVKTLMEDLGVNLAGIGIILNMGRRINELQRRVEELEDELRRSGGEQEE